MTAWGLSLGTEVFHSYLLALLKGGLMQIRSTEGKKKRDKNLVPIWL